MEMKREGAVEMGIGNNDDDHDDMCRHWCIMILIDLKKGKYTWRSLIFSRYCTLNFYL